jgi:hypothetical protein
MAMLLRGENDHEFELALVQDQYPEMQDGFRDSGFVTVSFRVATPEESWEETAPVMNLYELKNLIEWLRAVSQGTPEVSEVELLEPGLSFSVSRDEGEAVTIRIGFHLEDRPEEFRMDAPTDEAEYVDIRVPREHVGLAAAELERDLASATTAGRGADGAGAMGVMGAPDLDLNMLPEDAEGEFPQLLDGRDDIAAYDDEEERRAQRS